MARDTMIFLLQQLGFIINLKKSVIFTNKISATTASGMYKKEISLPFNSSLEPKFNSGTNMVGKQPRNIKWEVNFVTHKQNYNPNRCFSEGLGAYCQKMSIGGQWTLQESRLHISLLELKAINLALLTFHKMFSLKAASRQYNGSIVFDENGWDWKQGNDSSRQGNLGIRSITEDHNYCKYLPGKLNVRAN